MDLREHQQRAVRARWSKPEVVQRRVDALAAKIRDVVGSVPVTDAQRARLAVAAVSDKITAAVADAPPLPPDLAARLIELLRTTSGGRS